MASWEGKAPAHPIEETEKKYVKGEKVWELIKDGEFEVEVAPQ